MPIRSEWKLAREGITPDTLIALIRNTALNPALTIPLLVAAQYTAKGGLLAAQHGTAFSYLKKAVALGVLARLSGWLDDAVTNNFTGDVYDWGKEVVVVTGGSDGIGKAVVGLLAERGIKVAVVDVQPLTYEAPPTVTFFQCDLASPASITSTSAAIRTALGDPTILINNAGVARGKPILSTTEADLKLTFSVNTFSHYFLTQQFLPAMLARNHGMIVTVASTAAYVTAPSMTEYAASKAAALAFHEGLSAELATTYNASKVRTVVMCQGYTRTKLFDGLTSSALYPDTVAEGIVKAVLAGRSSHIVMPEVQALFTSGFRGFAAWVQYGIRKRLVKFMKGWQGRQVVQPSEKEKEKENEVEGSTVLVGKESS